VGLLSSEDSKLEQLFLVSRDEALRETVVEVYPGRWLGYPIPVDFSFIRHQAESEFPLTG